jgi:hypothetical protein
VSACGPPPISSGAGNLLSTRTRPDNPRLKTTLAQVESVAVRKEHVPPRAGPRYILKEDTTHHELDPTTSSYFNGGAGAIPL